MKLRIAVATILLCASVPAAQAVTYPDAGNVTPAQAPYVVSMWMVDEKLDRASDGFLCTGSLLDAYTVIIAAHCIQAVQNSYGFVFVRAQDNKLSRGEVLIPRKSLVHQNYDNLTIANDIALVDLYYPSSATTFLKVPSTAIENVLLQKRMAMFGWGLDELGEESEYLHKALLDRMDDAAEVEFSDQFNSAYQIGAGRLNMDGTWTGACSGDSGGPLTGSYKKAPYILGVVSFGAESICTAHAPTVFTRVGAYAKWIKRTKASLKTSRATDQVVITNSHFVNSSKKPLLYASGTSNGHKYRQYRARFVTEDMGQVQSDIKWLSVTSYQTVTNQWDVDVTVHSKQKWTSSACGLGAAYVSPDDFVSEGIPGQISLIVRSASTWKSQWAFTYSAAQDTCIDSAGVALTPQSLNGVAVPQTCEAALYPNSDGSLSFQLSRSCFPSQRSTYIRVQQSSFGVTDIEPGYDLWVGGLNLKNPA